MFSPSIYLAIGGLLLQSVVHVTPVVASSDSGSESAADSRPPKAEIECGPVQGVWEDGLAVFKGIPYGQPPTGDRRWRPSLKLGKDNGCWKNTLNATEFGNVCMQKRSFIAIGYEGDEDCLFVNVITPQLNRLAGLLPVAVWIHGGELLTGSGGHPAGHSPNPLFANHTGVVSVSFNYRLGVFGFLSLHTLNEGSGSGNYGFYDQILALKWVQENIAAFGGDKNRVTVYGQESGGTSIVALLSSPLAKGLFHGAVMMSASTTINATLDEADRANQEFIFYAGCWTTKCLREMSAKHVLKSYTNSGRCSIGQAGCQLPKYDPIDVRPVAVVDGVLLPLPSSEAIAQGKGNDVPIVVGTTAQETELDVPEPLVYYRGNWTIYEQYVYSHLGPFYQDSHHDNKNILQDVKRLYPDDFASPSSGDTCLTSNPVYLLTSMISDIRVTCPTILLAQYYAKYFKSPVYNYVVVQCPSKSAYHYSFDSWDLTLLFNPLADPMPRNKELGAVMQKWFSKFVHGESPHRQWKTVEHGTFSLTYEPEMLDSYHGEQCNYFNTHGFLPYRWQN